ncbi:hypothetical protein Tco_1456083 [Tanacetum coccineum]
MLTKLQVYYDDTHKQALGYKNPFYLKKAQRIKPTLYDGSVISRQHEVIPVTDEEETLILEEVSRSKMLAKQNDPISLKQKIIFSLINYSELNKLSEDFGKHFVPQQELSAEQAFWLPFSNPKSEHPNDTQTSVRVEVPKELPKVSLVNTSVKRLKNHLVSFDKVVKLRTTHDALTEGSWGFEHTKKVFNEEVIPFKNSLQTLVKDFENGLLNELNEVKKMFNQMEAAIDQCSVDKKLFEIEKKELKLENIVMHADVKSVNVLHVQNTFLDDNIALDVLKMENDRLMELLVSQDLVHTVLTVELAKKNDMIEKSVYNELSKKCSRREQRCISLELKLQHNKESFKNDKSCENPNAPEFREFFEINELKAQLQAKDTTISNLKKHIQELKGKSVVDYRESVNKQNVIAPAVLKLDLEPLSSKLKNNREAHVDYIRITKENADTLRDIVEQARTSNPLDNALAYACMYTKQVQELLVYVSDTCPSSPLKSEKLVAVTPMNKARKFTFAKTSTTSENNTKKQVDLHKTQTTNKPLVPSTSVKSSTNASGSIPRSTTKNTRILQTSSSNQKYQRVEAYTRNVKSSLDKGNSMSKSMCSTCKKCLFDANHDLCVVNYLSDVNARASAKSVKSIKKIWNTTGKMFKNVGYKWVHDMCRGRIRKIT